MFHLAAVVGGIKADIRASRGVLSRQHTAQHSGNRGGEEARVEKLVTVGSICAYPARMDVPLREERMWDGYPEPTNGPYRSPNETPGSS